MMTDTEDEAIDVHSDNMLALDFGPKAYCLFVTLSFIAYTHGNDGLPADVHEIRDMCDKYFNGKISTSEIEYVLDRSFVLGADNKWRPFGSLVRRAA